MVLLGHIQLIIAAALTTWAASLRAGRAEASHGVESSPGSAEWEATALAEAQRASRVGSYAVDLATGAVGSSEQLRCLLALEPDQSVDTGPALLACVHPDDRSALAGAWELARNGSQPPPLDLRIVHPSGAVRWVDGHVRVVAEAGGAPRRLIGTMQDVSGRRAVESALSHQALHDALTGLPSRASFLGRLAQVLANRQLRPTGLAVLFLDIDRVRWLSEGRRHEAGDELLLKLGRRLRASMRPSDTVARFGGDEFVVLCENVGGEQDATLLAGRLAAVLRRPVDVAGIESSITVSIGVAFRAADEPAGTSEVLVRDAKSAMREAKEEKHLLVAPGLGFEPRT